MGNWAIVAIPKDNDPVWTYSSEKVPHMTLLFLGDQSNNPDELRIAEYISHVVSNSMFPFGMSVEKRGVLGEDNADVLFFWEDRHGKSMISVARDHFLKDSGIKLAYDSIEQHPQWIPHLTMGYPKKPAKKDLREYPGFNWVEFDRIAFWTDDYSGPEFRLESKYSEETDMIMSETVEIFLEHVGVKGMKWGRRKANSIPDGEVRVKQKAPGQKLTSEGGNKIEAHTDAVKAATSKQIAKKSTIDALSTRELQELVTRMNLEQQYSKLSTSQTSPGKKFVNDLLSSTAKQQATRIAQEQASKLVTDALKKKAGG